MSPLLRIYQSSLVRHHMLSAHHTSSPSIKSSSMRLPTGCQDPASSSRDFSTRVQEERVGKRNVDIDRQLALGPSLLTSGGGGFHDTTISTWTRRRHDTLLHGRPESEEHVRQSNVGPRCIHPSRVSPRFSNRLGEKSGGEKNSSFCERD